MLNDEFNSSAVTLKTKLEAKKKTSINKSKIQHNAKLQFQTHIHN